MPEVTTADGVRVRYDEAGDGEPALLCLPGWCDRRTTFSEVLPRWARSSRVLALDWRGHGDSDVPRGDFGSAQLLEDALAVVHASGARWVVPVTISHAGWVALALRQRLGERVSHLVLLDWLVLEAPPPFLDALQALQQPGQWRAVRDQLLDLWLAHAEPSAARRVRETMGAHGAGMWARAGREIAASYAHEGSPLRALQALRPPVPTLHLYCQPKDPHYLEAQQGFARQHPWFQVERLEVDTHFPTLEAPDAVARAVEAFVRRQPSAP